MLHLKKSIPSILFLALNILGLLFLRFPGLRFYSPMSVRVLAGIFIFGITPGFLVLHILKISKSNSLIAQFLTLITLGFSCNLVINFLLFALGVSFDVFVLPYTVFIVLAALSWFLFSKKQVFEKPTWHYSAGLIAIAVLSAYVLGAPPTNPEELITLRKIAENPQVLYNNLSVGRGLPATYVFTPFQIFVVGVSKIAGIDGALAYSLLWCFTTLISILCFIELAEVLGPFPKAGLVMALMAGLICVFDDRSVMAYLGILKPYPNRYGFSGGVLLPLNLLLFSMLFKGGKINKVLWFLMGYLTVEMTFVHARETLLFVGIAGVGAAILATDPKSRNVFAKVLAVIGMTGAILLAYKWVNLKLSPQLNSYVGSLSAACWASLKTFVAENGKFWALFKSGPTEITLQVAGFPTPETVRMANYQDLFINAWTEDEALSRLVLPIVLFAMPYFLFFLKSKIDLFLAACLLAFLVVSQSGAIRLFLSGIVGNPEVMVFYGPIFIFAFLLFCSMVFQFSSHIVNRRGFDSKKWFWGISIGVATSLILPKWIFGLRFAFGSFWNSYAGDVWNLVSLGMLFYVLIRKKLPLAPQHRKDTSMALKVALSLVFLFFAPIVRLNFSHLKTLFSTDTPPSVFLGGFENDYGLLSKSKKLEPIAYPLSVLKFLRHELPPYQTLLSTDTLAAMVATTHYAGIVSEAGNVSGSYIVNWHYLLDLKADGYRYSFDPARIESWVRDLKIDYVILNPSENKIFKKKPSQFLVPVFESEGYQIVKVQL